ncbi:regulatory protein RecX [Bifidobacterium stellenboschense]|uniref:Regulatory protein RecX n=2 Tax=Bifidobacterium stellenboschense TaxID=762211 RepID=A0A087DIT5_9BIFI|nr:regulatory protein RecX [Bifidobacterium stellenboschense]KFI95435.1 regulatory protein RecX [Bifidobacterium stellenboschense]
MISAEAFLAGMGEPSIPAVRDDPSRRPAVHAGVVRTDDCMRGGSARDGAVARDDAADFDACREAALRLLDAAPRSSGALRDRLLGKGYEEDVVDAVIDRLIQVRLLDDRDYAESAMRYCVNRMMGRRGAVAELTRKGVTRSMAEQVAGEAAVDGAFEDAAWELGRKIARKTEGLDRQVRMRRFWSAGGRKGHDAETLRRVAAELFR